MNINIPLTYEESRDMLLIFIAVLCILPIIYYPDKAGSYLLIMFYSIFYGMSKIVPYMEKHPIKINLRCKR